MTNDHNPTCPRCGNNEHFSLTGTEHDARTYSYDGRECVDSKGCCCEETFYSKSDSCTCDGCGHVAKFDEFGFEFLWDVEPLSSIELQQLSDFIRFAINQSHREAWAPIGEKLLTRLEELKKGAV